MPDGYLLDTNIISIAVSPTDVRQSRVLARLAAIGSAPAYVCVITAGEIEYGLALATGGNDAQRTAIRTLLQQHPQLSIDRHTIEPYALLRARLFRRYGTPKNRGGFKQKVPEQLIDPATGKQLGIDERDLLIASVAVQYSLVLATADRNAEMIRIELVAQELEAEGLPVRLRVEDWNV